MKLKLITVCAFLLAGFESRANIILNQETWSVAGTGGWTGTNTTRDAAAWAKTIANSENKLTITADGDMAVRQDYVFVDSGPLAGNKNYINYGGGSNVTSISFDFSTVPGSAGTNTLPNALSVYFLSSKGSNNWLWAYDVPLESGVTSYEASIADYANWYNTQGHWDYSSFLADLADVDEVGISLEYWPNILDQQYQLDNFTLNTLIPEPADFAVLGIALLSLAMIFRGRLPPLCRAKID